MLLHGGLGTWVLSLLVPSILKEGKISIDNIANWPAIRLTLLTFIMVICLATIILVFASKYLRELLVLACVIFALFTISSAQGIYIEAWVFRNIYAGTTIGNDQAIQMVYSPMIFLWTVSITYLSIED
jgi:hypothetical protein